jgi:L-lactate dehydrogenase complex protein LldG
MTVADDDPRGKIFERIRTALGAERLDRARRSAVERRLARHPRGPLPARAKRQGEERVALFAGMLAKQGADVRRVSTPKEAVGAVASYLGTCNLPPRVRMGKDRALAGLPWREAWDLERASGAAGPNDRASLSHAVAGAAETGTLFLLSGPDNPTSLNFLPEAHCVLIAAADIFASYEDAFDRIRALSGGTLPRSVNLISGPSRTADIEQTIVRGAHGPRRLLVVILG